MKKCFACEEHCRRRGSACSSTAFLISSEVDGKKLILVTNDSSTRVFNVDWTLTLESIMHKVTRIACCMRTEFCHHHYQSKASQKEVHAKCDDCCPHNNGHVVVKKRLHATKDSMQFQKK